MLKKNEKRPVNLWGRRRESSKAIGSIRLSISKNRGGKYRDTFVGKSVRRRLHGRETGLETENIKRKDILF